MEVKDMNANPHCGCMVENKSLTGAYLDTNSCLYFQALQAHAATEAKLAEAVSIINELLTDSSWNGGPVMDRANAFVEKP